MIYDTGICMQAMQINDRERSYLNLAPATVSLVLDIMLTSAVPVLVFPCGASC